MSEGQATDPDVMTDQRQIGLSAPTAARNRVYIETWDVGGKHMRQLGIAAFTTAEARSFAAKLIAAAKQSERAS